MYSNDCILTVWKKFNLRLVFITSYLFCCLYTNAQTAVYNINLSNKTLKEAIKQIEKETGYIFFYDSSLIDSNKKVNYKFNNASIELIVKNLLPNYNYKFENKRIIVYSKKGEKADIDTSKQFIRGYITDQDNNPVIGANISETNTTNGTISDIDGQFGLAITPNAKIYISLLGYKPQTIENISKSNLLYIKLTEEEKLLNEIIVLGYGEITRKDLTGSVSNVRLSDVKDAPITSLDQALQGRIAGIDVMSTTGEPGATTSIRIRGTRSISATNEPLIVIDGIIDGVNDLADLNPFDVESISIIKDASAAAIYGSRGSNGAIIIKTKRGKTGKPRIFFKSDIGLSSLPRKLDLMNGAEFAQYRNDYELLQPGSSGEIPFPNPLELGKGTNWVDTISQSAIFQNHLLSVSGGSQKTSYYTSFSYNNTEGIVKRSGLQRYTARISIDHQFTKWLKAGYYYNYTYRDQDVNLVALGGENWWNAAIYLSPLIDVNSDFNDYWYSGQRFDSPMAKLKMNSHQRKNHLDNHMAYLELCPTQKLKLRTQGTYSKYSIQEYRYDHSSLPSNNNHQGGNAYRRDYNKKNFLSETTATYSQELGNTHKFDLLIGFSGQQWHSNNFSLFGSGYLLDKLQWNDMGAVLDKQNYSASSNFAKIAKMSIFARFNYNYKNKYYLTLSARRDGSSNFAINRKWGNFPSAAFKWNITNEEFANKLNNVDQIAIRLSAGKTGNDGISPFQSRPALKSTTNGYLFNNKQLVSYYPSRLENKRLTWETTSMYNLGIDLSFFNNRILATTEAYISQTKDMLLNQPTPTHTGYEEAFVNIGKASNEGIELSLTSRNIISKEFDWESSITISHNRQKVLDIGTNEFVSAYSTYGNNKHMMYGYVKDYPLNALWGFKYAGTWKNQDEVDRNRITKAYASASNLQLNPGYARYLDINHDGILNDKDLVYLGNADPWIHGGIQNKFRIKNFSILLYFHYSLGGKIYNISEQWMGNGSPFTNQYRFMVNAWHPVRNPNSDIPRAGNNDGVASDRMVYDASFLRFKSFSIGYKYNVKGYMKNLIDHVTFSLNAENIYLWKKYNGFDPDVSSNSSDATLRRVDIGAYPKPRTITFSISISH